MFLPSSQVARMALHCRDRSGREQVPDLSVTSRRAVPWGRDVSDHLDVVREAIGERLVRLVSGLAVEAALREAPSGRMLVLTDGKRFTPQVEQRLAERLGLSRTAKEFSEFQMSLATAFFQWLTDHPRLRERMRGEIEDEEFYVRYPVLRRRESR